MRQQRERFDQQQRRRHHQVLAGHVEVERVEQFQIGEVLLGNDAGSNIARVEFGPLNKMEQQIKRPFIDRQSKARPRRAFDTQRGLL